MKNVREDLRRWRLQGYRPRDASPVPARLTTRVVVVMLWRFPAIWATLLYRASFWCTVHGVRLLPSILYRLNMALFGIEISSAMPVGPGLYIPHPGGSVIMAKRIGANASFIHACTLGMRETHDFPVLGDGVLVGAGARVLGGIRIGDGSTIGANAVVIHDVPAGATAVGVPARIRQPAREEPVA